MLHFVHILYPLLNSMKSRPVCLFINFPWFWSWLTEEIGEIASVIKLGEAHHRVRSGTKGGVFLYVEGPFCKFWRKLLLTYMMYLHFVCSVCYLECVARVIHGLEYMICSLPTRNLIISIIMWKKWEDVKVLVDMLFLMSPFPSFLCPVCSSLSCYSYIVHLLTYQQSWCCQCLKVKWNSMELVYLLSRR
jgi:hypothetical protein